MLSADGSPTTVDGHARHRAVVYEDAAGFVELVGGFLCEGVSQRDRVLVATTARKRSWLRDALGNASEAVEWVDAHALYARHGPMFAEVIGVLARHAKGGNGRVRIVAEQPGLRGDAERRAYMRYEAAANVAYRRFAASVLCPYDAGGLPDAVLEDVFRTHPEVLTPDGPRASEAFVDPRAFIRLRSRIQAPPQGAPAVAIEDADDLARARTWVCARAAAAGLDAERIEELEVAVSEAATNALVHGAPPRCVWVYEREGMLICHVHDGGRGLADPLAGYLPPESRSEGGRGLWLMRQICDVVEAADDETGSHIYLGLRL